MSIHKAVNSCNKYCLIIIIIDTVNWQPPQLRRLEPRANAKDWLHGSMKKAVEENGYSLQGGVVGGGVQWMGVVLYGKTAYNIIM